MTFWRSLIQQVENWLESQGRAGIEFERYALVPVTQLVNQDAPFRDWKAPGVTLAADQKDAISVCVWMYQLYVFYTLVAEEFGQDVANRALQLQAERLSRADESLGERLLNDIKMLRTCCAAHEPREIAYKGEKVEESLEHAVALRFMVTSHGPPFYGERYSSSSDDESFDLDLQFDFATCLAHGKEAALAKFRAARDAAIIRG